MFSRFVPALLALLLCLASVPASADYGGGDAPDDWQNAVEVGPGVYAATLGGGDPADWSMVMHGEGMGVRVTITVPGDAHTHLLLRGVDGRYLSDIHLSPDMTVGSGPITRSLVLAGDGGVRVGVDLWEETNAFDYTLVLEVVDLPDFTPTEVEVEPVPVQTDMGPVATGTIRDITLTVENVGLGAGDGYVSVYAVSRTDGRSTPIGSAGISLGAGDATTIQMRWDGKGVVGDVTIRAFANAYLDADWQNGARSTDSYVLVGGTGVGVTATAPGLGTCTPTPQVQACAVVTGSNVLAAIYGSAILGGGYGHVVAGTSGVHAFAGAGTLAAGASVLAYHGVPSSGGVAACASALGIGTCQGTWLP